ncbi:MAG: hypothetical protein ACYSWQ_00815 [Planctomycetota bacterium]|jgi:hypothetical protein
MARSQGDLQKGRALPGSAQDVCSNEGETDLTDYCRVLWKRKYLILLLTLVPVSIFLLVLILSPKDYKVAYLYDAWLDREPCRVLSSEVGNVNHLYRLQGQLKDEWIEKNHKILLDEFHSAENLDKLAAKLEENRLDKYVQNMAREDIGLTVSGTSLAMTIVGRPQEDMVRISSVVRDNLENVIPIGFVKNELICTIAELKAKMADIEEGRFSRELELEKEKAILTRLKDSEAANPNRIPGNITLQLDNISKNSEYLPLAYQIQIAVANIINIEENIKEIQEKYKYYRNLVGLNERLFDEIDNKASSYYTIQEFHSFLTGKVDDYEDKELKDCLNAYVKKVENAISTNTVISEKPGIQPVPKDIVKKVAVSFGAFLMIASFAAFFLEAVQQGQAPTS